MRQSLRQTVLATTAILGLSAAAIAAPPGAGDPTKSPSDAQAQAPSSTQGQAPNNMTADVEQKISDLQSKLQISSSQKTQWDRFAAVMRENARDMDKVFQARSQSLESMSAEANMKSYAQLAERHAQDVQKLVPAFDALYASMSPSQKQTADQVFRQDAGQGQAGAAGKNG
jgi:protein CpxP